MNHSRLKYQQYFTTLLLLFAYLVGNFSLPLIEGIHFLLHLGDETSIHSFQSHDSQHQHQVLTSLEELATTSSKEEVPIKNTSDKKLKKIVQQLAVVPTLFASNLLFPTSNYTTPSINYLTLFLSVNSPPPEV